MVAPVQSIVKDSFCGTAAFSYGQIGSFNKPRYKGGIVSSQWGRFEKNCQINAVAFTRVTLGPITDSGRPDSCPPGQAWP